MESGSPRDDATKSTSDSTNSIKRVGKELKITNSADSATYRGDSSREEITHHILQSRRYRTQIHFGA